MTLELRGVSKTVEGQTHIYPTDLTLEKGTMNVLLGPTLSGKTSLMRLMAGLDVPATGQIFWNGTDVTGQRVQDRKVAMVYQQFINYPSMTVYDNIASPMKLMGVDKAEIDRRVRETAELMKLTPMLERKPLELSGGQQQRCALARARRMPSARSSTCGACAPLCTPRRRPPTAGAARRSWERGRGGEA